MYSRFAKKLHPRALEFSSSLPVDSRLFREDIAGSLAHVDMLSRQKIIPVREARQIRRALQEILKEIESGQIPPRGKPRGANRLQADDIHMAIEGRLIEKVGSIGGKLHTARSRNDQVALDELLYLRSAVQRILRGIRQLQRSILNRAERYQTMIIPGYTHLQQGQPVLLSHHLLAYVSMLERDHARFHDCLDRASDSPLGAAALAGTSFPIDREYVARKLGLRGVVENSIDAVSDRDTVLEFVANSSITMMHLSRFAEEIVLWSSAEWDLIEVADEFTSGSSIMPQKKNPDIAELVRGKTGRVYGNLVALLTIMKGLPLSYNRDMQEDKEPLFDSADTLERSLGIMAAMVRTITFNTTRFQKELVSTLATDLADYLVRKGMPFRRAYLIVSDIVRHTARQGKSLKELPLAFYRRYSRLFEGDLYRLLEPSTSVSRKRSMGSTSPREVKRSLAAWKKRLGRG